jgi:Fur family ferric uptake transcriptional regulator
MVISKPFALAEHLKQAGHKLTRPRLAVLEVLKTHPEHLNHSQILEAGKKICPQLSRATVYRTMELLVTLNLARPLYLNDSTPHFMVVTSGHHHMICSACGLVLEFDQCLSRQIVQAVAEQYQFLVQSHLLEFYGLCQDCRS